MQAIMSARCMGSRAVASLLATVEGSEALVPFGQRRELWGTDHLLTQWRELWSADCFIRHLLVGL